MANARADSERKVKRAAHARARQPAYLLRTPGKRDSGPSQEEALERYFGLDPREMHAETKMHPASIAGMAHPRTPDVEAFGVVEA